MDDDVEEDDVTGYTPPFIKWGGFYFGKNKGPSTTWGGEKPCVHHSVYVAEIEARRKEDGQDWNGAMLSNLMHDLLEANNGGYEGFDRGAYSIRAFCWCENDGCPWCESGEWYFKHPSSDFCVRWYKHPNRGIMASREYMAADIDAMRALLIPPTPERRTAGEKP